MWHASVSHPDRRVRRKIALKALAGVGSIALGEWHDDRINAYHVRRRLTPGEQSFIGEVKDLRGTFEAQIRAQDFLDAMNGHQAFHTLREAVLSELR